MPHRDRRPRLRSRKGRQAARQRVPTASNPTGPVRASRCVVCCLKRKLIRSAAESNP